MAELNKIQFFLFVSLMILSALVSATPTVNTPKPQENAPEFPENTPNPPRAQKPPQLLHMTLMDYCRNIKYKAEIKSRDENNITKYISVKEAYHMRSDDTTKVIIYIFSSAAYKEIMAGRCDENRIKIHNTLMDQHYEILYLQVVNYKPGDEYLIGQFILETVKPNVNQQNTTIETIGKEQFDIAYPPTDILKRYQEEPVVYGGNFGQLLKAMSTFSVQRRS